MTTQAGARHLTTDDQLTQPAVPPVNMPQLMAGFPTGVGIITSFDEEQSPWGMTCTSVASVSLAPPTLLVCLRSGSPTLQAVLSSERFALNLLDEDARPTAELFASGAVDRFDRTEWSLPGGSGGPHLHLAAHTVADCKVTQTSAIGDHLVVFGEVTAVAHRREPAPLLYGLRRYAGWPGRS